MFSNAFFSAEAKPEIKSDNPGTKPFRQHNQPGSSVQKAVRRVFMLVMLIPELVILFRRRAVHNQSG